MIDVRYIILFIIPVALLLVSCTTQIGGRGERAVKKRPFYKVFDIKNIAVIPFIYTGQKDMTLPNTTAEYVHWGEFLTDAVYREMQAKITNATIGPLDSSYAEFGLTADKVTKQNYKDVAQKVCNRLGHQTALIGELTHFRKREGGEGGVESPAFVAFDVHLYKCEGWVLLWEDTFAETQQSLLENLVNIKKFFKRGAKWITARQLALEGVEQVVDNLKFYLETD